MSPPPPRADVFVLRRPLTLWPITGQTASPRQKRRTCESGCAKAWQIKGDNTVMWNLTCSKTFGEGPSLYHRLPRLWANSQNRHMKTNCNKKGTRCNVMPCPSKRLNPFKSSGEDFLKKTNTPTCSDGQERAASVSAYSGFLLVACNVWTNVLT